MLTRVAAEIGSLVEIVSRRAEHEADRIAYSFLRDGEDDVETITYAALDRRARSLAARIQERAGRGARVLLLVSPGIDFVVATFASLYAGAVGVPSIAPSPRHVGRMLDHVRALAADSGAVLAFTRAAATAEALRAQAPDLGRLAWLATADAEADAADAWQRPMLADPDLALLQYTSGSTQNPKGVMISHGNLMANLAFQQAALCRGFAVEGVMWLPPYHDMGLVGGIFLAAYNGHHVTLMSPAHFLQRPLRWLQAISRRRATHTAAPNFALDLCVRRINAEQRSGLDLSCLTMLLCGGEPVRADTLQRFTEAFAPVGFDPRALTPAYGLAESTLMAAAAPVRRPAAIASFDAMSLRRGSVVPAQSGRPALHLVGCGAAEADSILILDPQRNRAAPPGRIGEICLSGPSAAAGYWNRPEDTRSIVLDLKGRRYLRSGDLGFIADDELFVMGRSRDLVIINGQNHQPQDIEETVEREAGLAANGSAAFGLDAGGEERLGVVAELEPRGDADFADILRRLRKGIAARHDLPLGRLALIRRGGLPKTTSGKVRRGEARRRLLEGRLPLLYGWETPAGASAPAMNGGNGSAAAWLRRQIAQLTGEPVEEMPGTVLLSELGLSSLQIAELLQRAEIHFARPLPLSEMPRHLSLDDVSALVAGGSGDAIRLPPHRPANGRGGSLAPVEALQARFRELADLGLENPFFTVHDGTACDTTTIAGRPHINFASYNYLGLSGHPAVNAAAKAAIDAMGTSVSASRLVSGERPLHRSLEAALAALIGAEDAIVLVSGNLTNVTVLGHLAGPEDLIVHDALAHDSIVQGAKLSGAAHRAFPHNDWRALDELLAAVGGGYRAIFIAIEGVYSMDGDIPDLRRFVEVKRRHGAWLLVDEAHSIGVLGSRGRGIAEHAGVEAGDVELWMGTLSKAFASCGGYIAGSAELVQYLKYTAPGFVFSVGMPPSATAAALAAIRQLEQEPERVARLHARSALFLERARAAGLDTGSSAGSPVIPVILGDSVKAIACAMRLRKRGINVQPVVHPAVEENAARLRFFISSEHRPEQIEAAVAAVAEVVRELSGPPESWLAAVPPALEAAAAAAAGAPL
jgi:8-amino-7-oxononanoate synthase